MESISGESPASNATNSNSQDTSDASQSSYAFLVHSQNTLNNHLPPAIDNQPLARQRRRRTSPEDHAILEAEYAKNPKPDKAARIAIVNYVALGEKEVQIWFQNRRQMTRRKSKPLLPHEVANYRWSQGSAEDVLCSSFSMDESSQQQPWSSQSSIHMSQSSLEEKQILLPIKALEPEKVTSDFPSLGQSHVLGLVAKPAQTSTVTGDSFNSSMASEKFSDTRTSLSPEPSSIPEVPILQEAPSTSEIRDLKNCRSSPFSMYQEDCEGSLPSTMPSAAKITVPGGSSKSKAAVPQVLERTSSSVRLSMSLDGKAKVTTGSESSPSPPRSQTSSIARPTPRVRGGLHRTQSAMEPTSMTPVEGILSSSVYSRRPMTGRSRDARTWEFYCDSDARAALTIQAEREQSGSAAGAIGLIRSQSNKAMAVNSNKRNAHQAKHESTKRLKSIGQKLPKPKLARTTSSVARLQTVSGNGNNQAAKCMDKDPKSGSSTAIYQDCDGDSDKENWEPGTQTSRIPRPQTVSTQQSNGMRRAVLEESLHVPSQSSSMGTLMNRKTIKSRRFSKEGSSGKENSSLEEDDEVEKFMSEASVPREVEDLDCVQNLLSLSQAAWH